MNFDLPVRGLALRKWLIESGLIWGNVRRSGFRATLLFCGTGPGPTIVFPPTIRNVFGSTYANKWLKKTTNVLISHKPVQMKSQILHRLLAFLSLSLIAILPSDFDIPLSIHHLISNLVILIPSRDHLSPSRDVSQASDLTWWIFVFEVVIQKQHFVVDDVKEKKLIRHLRVKLLMVQIAILLNRKLDREIGHVVLTQLKKNGSFIWTLLLA